MHFRKDDRQPVSSNDEDLISDTRCKLQNKTSEETSSPFNATTSDPSKYSTNNELKCGNDHASYLTTVENDEVIVESKDEADAHLCPLPEFQNSSSDTYSAVAAETMADEPTCESPIPIPKASYAIDWDNFDENVNPFQPRVKISSSPPTSDGIKTKVVPSDQEINPFKPSRKLAQSPPPGGSPKQDCLLTNNNKSEIPPDLNGIQDAHEDPCKDKSQCLETSSSTAVENDTSTQSVVNNVPK